MIKIPAFGEARVIESRENNTAKAFFIAEAGREAFGKYGELLIDDGFALFEERARGGNRYAAYRSGDVGVFVNYYGGTDELFIVVEDGCAYFDYGDTAGESSVAIELTQIALEDFGLSYVIRLSDGRFIIIDGGWDFEPDADKLYRCLSRGALGERPRIAAWIMTHPHCDHFHCFMPFFDKYGERVNIEKFIYNFPEHDDLERYPTLSKQDVRVGDCSALTNIPRMLERIERSGALTYKAHTGQTYRIGDAKIELLASMDDTIHRSANVNTTSLVFRMEIAGQVILWTADASFGDARLAERYGGYLRADILQVPHHGFGMGSAEAEIEGYEYILPEVCLLPSLEYDAFYDFALYKKGTRHLMTRLGIRELIDGSVERTLKLPYHAPRYAERELRERVRAGFESGGALVWVFSELSTADADDFYFSLLNTCNVNATVWGELFFEDRALNVRHIKITLPRLQLTRLSIIGDEVDGDALFFNSQSLAKLGVPENAAFAVRFISDVPIVVSHKKHLPSHSSGAWVYDK